MHDSLAEPPGAASLVYPRLDAGTSLLLYQSLIPLGIDELRHLASLDHAQASPIATGGRPATEADLRRVQSSIRAVAAEAGYPDGPNLAATQQFDRRCGTRLYSEMGIVPADAAAEGVWSFITLVLAPDVAVWRYRDRAEDRLLGRRRNVFRKLWWRAWALGPDLESVPPGVAPLGEDEFVGIMERPSIGGNRTRARAVRDALWRHQEAYAGLPRSEVMRELTVRYRAMLAFVSVDSLSAHDHDGLLDELMPATIRGAAERKARAGSRLSSSK
jgi:hypothetical protein